MDLPQSALVALLISGVVGTLAIITVATAVPDFFDDCHTFGDTGPTPPVSPGGPCQSASSTSETRGETVARLAVIQGSAIAATVLAYVGAARRHGHYFAAAGAIYGLLVVPLLFGLAWLVVLPASIACFVAATRLWPRPAA